MAGPPSRPYGDCSLQHHGGDARLPHALTLAPLPHMRPPTGAASSTRPVCVCAQLHQHPQPTLSHQSRARAQVYCNNGSCKALIASVFGEDLAEKEELVGAVDRWISILKSEGVSNALSLLIPEEVQVNGTTRVPQKITWFINFSLYQSGIDSSVPIQTVPSYRLTEGFVKALYRILLST